MWTDHIAILKCPRTGQPLRYLNADFLSTTDGQYLYPVEDDVICLLPESAIANANAQSDERQKTAPGRNTKDVVQRFYDETGWQLTDTGQYGDTKAFVDSRPLSSRFSDKCMRHMRGYLPRSGRYLIDAGSGAIPHHAYLSYHAGFEYRVCIDFSKEALKQAKKKLGARGVYILGDITNLPILSEMVEGVTCNHVLYHIAPEQQSIAFQELWRVLKRGGRAVVVYAWAYSPIAVRLDNLAARIMPPNISSSEAGASLPFFPQSLEWFTAQRWPFRYQIRPFRAVGNGFLHRHVGDNLRSRLMLLGIWWLQILMPGFVGRHGQHPAIVIEK